MLTHESNLALIDREEEIAKCLNSYLYHNVHSRPYSEYRHNIKMFPLFPVPKANVFNTSSTTIMLPSTGRWFIYTVENNAFVQIKLPVLNKWMPLTDFINQTGVDIRFIITTTGRLICRSSIYVMKNPKANNFFFVIKKDAIMRLLDPGANFEMTTDININVYYHHTGEYFNVTSYEDNSRDSYRTQFYQAIYSSSAYQKIVYIDGVEITPYSREGNRVLNVEDISRNCVGEIITDSSICGVAEFDIDDSSLLYRDRKGTTKVLIHLPKSINPANEILNHHVCDIYVHPDRNSTDRYVNGYYVDRFDTTNYFSTLTHNDFGIAKILLDTYSEHFVNAGTFTVKVFVRNHKKGFTLTKEPNHIASLYQLTDDEIIQELLGKTANTFWSASQLEQSKWVSVMDTYLEEFGIEQLPRLVETLGYNVSANAACKRVVDVLVSNELNKRFFIPIPLCYIEEDNLVCHVFKEGVKLSEDYFTFERDKQFLIVTILPNYNVEVGDRLTFEIFEDIPYKCREFVLSPQSTITLEVDGEFDLYYKVPLTGNNKLQDNTIYKRFNVNTSYAELSAIERAECVSVQDKEDGVSWVTIKNITGKANEFLIASRNAYQKIYGVERHLKEFNYDLICSHMLTVKAGLFSVVDSDGEVEDTEGQIATIPYINTKKNNLVYLNGRELVKGIDYQDYSILTNLNYICGKFVIIQNVDYLQLVYNAIEVFMINEDIAALDTGFLTNKTTDKVASYMSYFCNNGMLFLDGKVDRSITENYYLTAEDSRNGALYKIRALVPKCLANILHRGGSENTDRIDKVINYVESKKQSELTLAPITRSHHIYSTFIQTVTEKLLRGEFKPRRDWSDDRLKSELSKYEDVIPFDLGLSKDNQEILDPELYVKERTKGLDFRFVDVLPSYRVERLEDSDLSIQERRPLMIVSGSSIPSVNGNYICSNPGIEYMRHASAEHTNENTYKVWSNLNSEYRMEHDGEYWAILDNNNTVYYKARDTRGVVNIWELEWEPVVVGAGAISIAIRYVEVNTSNEFRIHRLSFTNSIDEYAILMRIARLYLKQDLAKDGMNI